MGTGYCTYEQVSYCLETQHRYSLLAFIVVDRCTAGRKTIMFLEEPILSAIFAADRHLVFTTCTFIRMDCFPIELSLVSTPSPVYIHICCVTKS